MLTAVMPSQQQKPRISGLPPVFTSFTMFVLKPIAAIAQIMKNLLNSFTGLKIAAFTPKTEVATVVISEASTKYRMKKGNIFLRLKAFFAFSPFPSDFFAFRAFHRARHKVIGIIARVRVNFTVTALSKVALPKP